MCLETDILEYIKQNPATCYDICNHFNLNIRTARYQIMKLKRSNKIRMRYDFKDMRCISYVIA